MDNWVLMSVRTLINKEIDKNSPANKVGTDQIKVRVSHILVTDFDALLFNGDIEPIYPKTLGHEGLGVIAETGANVHSYTKGQRVYLEPAKACGKCYACKSGHPEQCISPLLAGKTFDGFMRDIIVCKESDVVYLSDLIDDVHALCIEAVGMAEAIYERLSLNAGDKVAIIGMGFYGNIIAQTLKYHKIVPIAIDNSEENLRRSEAAGVFFNFYADDDLDANISSATSGNLCDAVIYCAPTHLSPNLAIRICAPGRTLILTSPASTKSNTSGNSSASSSANDIHVHDILDKHLTITAITTSYGYTNKAIRILTGGVINTDFFEKKIITDESYNPVPILEERNQNASFSKANKLTIIKRVF
ncbi:MAG: alcohol dehydrogenase catalytic domain-containing protein [Clostridia bacterium]|nr:alcohol dehydrogenase catalytic domain-containing protein [Clostridia bacterium]